MGNLLDDLRYSLRILRRQPWIVLAAVLTLGLGIGATAAIFSLVNAIYLKPMPFEVDGLVQVERLRAPTFPTARVSARQFVFWRHKFWTDDQWSESAGEAGSPPFIGLAAYSHDPVIITADGEDQPRIMRSCYVTGDFFKVFGVEPRIGRPFGSDELSPGGPRSVILSHRTWQRDFGADTDILGHLVRLDGFEHEVVGVMPPDFDYPVGIDVWLPQQVDVSTEENIAVFQVSARLRPDVTLAEAQQSMEAVARGFAELGIIPPVDGFTETLRVTPILTFLYGNHRNTLLLLGGGGFFLLLIACANVVNLQMARFGHRQAEIATRLALGGRFREILRLLLVENLILSAAGGVLGLILCYFMAPVVRFALPGSLSLFHSVEIDLTVATVIFAIVFAVGIATGLVPAFKARKVPLTTAMRESSTRGSQGRSQRWRSWALVGSQVSLAVMLMIGAALLVKSSRTVAKIDPGLRTEQVLTAELGLSNVAHRTSAAWDKLSRELLRELAAVPGVGTASIATSLPMKGGPPIGFQIVGQASNEEATFGNVRFLGVGADYFSTLGIPLVRGRAIEARDSLGGEAVVVVNEAMAARFWPGSDPIGQVITLGSPQFPQYGDDRLRRVVGVVANVRENGFAAPPPFILYIPLSQVPESYIPRLTTVRPLGLVFQTQVDPLSLGRMIQETVWKFDPDLPVESIQPLASLLDVMLGPARYSSAVVGLFAALSLLLSVVGVYGVLTHLVTRRTREIGIRMAFGGGPREILHLVLRHGMIAVGGGVLTGIAAAAALNQVIGSVLIISAFDLSAFVAAPLLFIAVAFVAMLLPALRAARVEPSQALRFE